MEKYNYQLSNDIINFIKTDFIEKNNIDNNFDKLWNKWILTEGIDRIFKLENERLNMIGWEGDIYMKVYKSIKYYQIKKSEKKCAKKKRRNYIHISENTKKQMYEFIDNTKIKKPSDAYSAFLNTYKSIYDNETKLLKEYLSEKEIIIKIKKTFKNRFYIKNKT
jgi:hypothetical protein